MEYIKNRLVKQMFLLTLLILIQVAGTTQGIRLCAPGNNKEDHCNQMQKDLSSKDVQLHCIQARDRYECLEFLIRDYVDVALAAPEDVYISQRRFDAQLRILGETRLSESAGDAFRYEAVAVVRTASVKSLSDLKGSKSCHTGYRRTAGWHIPISHLLEKNILPRPCATSPALTVAEQDLKSVSSYFGAACIPGKWAPDEQTNRRLKLKYEKLCSLCANPQKCESEDQFAGYEGALRCLTDSGADVAWTKLSTVQEFMKKNQNATRQFGFLCPDGVVNHLTKPCRWAARPWTAWLASAKSSHHKDIQKNLMRAMVVGANSGGNVRPWARALLGIKNSSVFVASPSKPSPEEFLNKQAGYGLTINRPICPEKPIKLCVHSEAAKRKCNALAMVLQSRRIRPDLDCILGTPSQDCLDLVDRGMADTTTADGGELFTGNRKYGLVPLLSEQYGLLDISYFAVAVIKANSGINSLADLRGKKSCHTGMGRTAGWYIPVATLISEGLLSSGTCDYPKAIAKFFSASCIPGAKDPNYDPKGNNPESLCGLCPREEVSVAGGEERSPYTLSGTTHSKRCTKSGDEPYSGYSGALRCLVEGGGDVAFVKHTTIGENSNGNSKEPWAQNLKPQDFRLLCVPSGTAAATDFDWCYWSKVPAHKVIAKPELPEAVKEDIRILLMNAADRFPSGQDVFSLFGPFQMKKDLIFKDSATGLVAAEENSVHNTVEQNYFRKLTELHACGEASGQALTAGQTASQKISSVYPQLTSLLVLVFASFYLCNLKNF